MKTSRYFLGLIVVSILAVGPLAQAKSKSDVRSITGCLARGEAAHEFTLVGDDGSTWELKSPRVALAKHVGHTIAATGVVAHSKMHNLKEDAKDAAKDTGAKKDTSEHGHLTVTSIKMVGETCTK